MMANASQAAPSPAAGPSRISAKDIEGVGKFKLAAVKGNRYKDKFQVLREQYDNVTTKQNALRRELDVASTILKGLQAENDLLLDAMRIVVQNQPALQDILRQLSPQAETPPALNGNGRGIHGHPYPLPERMNGDSPPVEYDAVQAHADYPPTDELNGR